MTYTSSMQVVGTTVQTSSSSPATTPVTPITQNQTNVRFSATTTQASQNIEGFFDNIFKAFDVFAQVINLSYFQNPMAVHVVSFDRIVNALVALSQPRDNLGVLLDGCRSSKLNLDSNAYRNCATHRNALQFKAILEIEPLSIAPSFNVKAILLPDDPNVPATYVHNVESRKYCESVLRHSLAVVDCGFRIMEQTCLAANQIPI